MKYFITGATGFIGARVAEKLTARGDRVVALARDPIQADELRAMGVELARGDITERESMRAPMQGADSVIHSAAIYEIAYYDRARMRAANVDGAENVFSLARELKIPRLVHVSTVGVFGDTRGQVADENFQRLAPHVTEYERTKEEAHALAQKYIAQGAPIIIVQPSVVYGPNNHDGLRDLMLELLQGRLPLLPSPKSSYSFVYVDDVVDGIILAADKGRIGETYILAGENATMRVWANKVGQIAQVPIPRVGIPGGALKAAAGLVSGIERFVHLPGIYKAESLRAAADITRTASSEKARRELGYRFRSLDEGLRETIDWERQRIDTDKRMQENNVRAS